MKTRIVLLLLLMIPAALSAREKKSYAKHNKGYFFDAGVAAGCRFPKHNEPILLMEVYTTHGYQFSNTFSLGVGVATYNTETINAYLQTRFNLRNIDEKKSHYTYIAVRLGYSWSTWPGDAWGDDKGPLIDPRFGWSFYTPAVNLRWSVYAAPSFYQFNFIPKVGLSFEF